jgi:hypothetical protein
MSIFDTITVEEPKKNPVSGTMSGTVFDAVIADPGFGTEEPERDNLIQRGIKQYANKTALDLIEKNRPSSSIVEGFSTLEGAFDKLASDPFMQQYEVKKQRFKETGNPDDKPTFLDDIRTLPKIWWALTSSYYSPQRKAQTEQGIEQLKGLRPAANIEVPEAKTKAEKITDVGAGLGAFVTQLFITKKLIPAGTVIPDAVAWEIINQSEGGIPGQGAAMAGTLGQLGKLPTPIKYSAESALFAGLTASQGGKIEDVLISAGIPFVFPAVKKFTKWADFKATNPEFAKKVDAATHRDISHAQAKAEVLNARNGYAANPSDPAARAEWERVTAKYGGAGSIQTNKPQTKQPAVTKDFGRNLPIPAQTPAAEAAKPVETGVISTPVSQTPEKTGGTVFDQIDAAQPIVERPVESGQVEFPIPSQTPAQIEPQAGGEGEEDYFSLYHQTTPDIAGKIKKEGFIVKRGKAAAGDIMPLGINTKSTDKPIMLTEGEQEQLEVKLSKTANIKQFENRTEVEKYLSLKNDAYYEKLKELRKLDVDYGKIVDNLLKFKEGMSDQEYDANLSKSEEIIDKWKQKYNVIGDELAKIGREQFINEGFDAVGIKNDTGGVFGNKTTDNTIILNERKILSPAPPAQEGAKEASAKIATANTSEEVNQAVSGITQSLRQADIEKSREEMGLGGIASRERKSFQKMVANGVEQKVPENALSIANEVLKTKRVLTDDEVGGFTARLVQLKTEYENLVRERSQAKTDSEIDDLTVKLNRVEAEFDTISEAGHKTGTETARALVARKITLNEAWDVISLKYQSKKAKGKPLSKAESEKFEELGTQLSKMNETIQRLEARINEMNAMKRVKEGKVSRYKKMNQADKQIELNDLVERTRQLLKDGC